MNSCPVANTLDLLIEDDQVIILAGNGFFKVKEKELLKENFSFTYFNKQDGLPIDFTANAGNSIKDGVLYMCGTTGATSIDLNESMEEVPVRLYINKFTEDEEPRVKVLLIFLASGVMVLFSILAVSLREKGIKRKYYLKFLQEKEKEIADIAYKDPITGVYNRNYFEYEKDRIDLKKMYALLSVSINHAEYFKRKYEVFFMESILRKGVSILQECTSEKIRICRVSENVFYFWFMEPVQMETYIHDIKTTFEQEGKKVNIPYSFSVGAIYNNTVGKENIDELIDRCGKMRLLDEKHAEAKFVEGKMKLL